MQIISEYLNHGLYVAPLFKKILMGVLTVNGDVFIIKNIANSVILLWKLIQISS